MAINSNGIIYYKLDANAHGYTGDITKNNGLRGEEIDGNFYFLRGHDIESMSFDENNNLILKRYNGNTIITEIPNNNTNILKNVYLDTTDENNPLLVFVFETETNEETIKVPVKELLTVYKPGNGIELNENTISIQLDEKSDDYLSVSDNGIKLYGVSNAIENLTNQIQLLTDELIKTKNELSELKAKCITEIKGNDNEISVTVTDNVATVGFASDTYFIAG